MATDGNGFGLFLRFSRATDLPLVAVGCAPRLHKGSTSGAALQSVGDAGDRPSPSSVQVARQRGLLIEGSVRLMSDDCLESEGTSDWRIDG